MKLIPQELSTCMTSMPIIHSEEGAFRPFFIFSMSWFCDVKDDWHSVFIVVSDKALVSNCRVSSNYSVSLYRTFCRLFIWDDDSSTRLQGKFFVLKLFFRGGFVDHLIDVKRSELLYLLTLSTYLVFLDRSLNSTCTLFEQGFDIQSLWTDKGRFVRS